MSHEFARRAPTRCIPQPKPARSGAPAWWHTSAGVWIICGHIASPPLAHEHFQINTAYQVMRKVKTLLRDVTSHLASPELLFTKRLIERKIFDIQFCKRYVRCRSRRDGLRRRILIALNIDLVVQHVVKHVEQQNVASIEPVFDPEQPIGSTRAMRT